MSVQYEWVYDPNRGYPVRREKPDKSPQTFQEYKQAGYTPLISRYGPTGPEYLLYRTPQPKEALLAAYPTPKRTEEPFQPPVSAYRPPDVILRTTKLTPYRPPDVIVGERTRIGKRAIAEGLIPGEAEITHVTPTKEGYQLEYVLPSQQPVAEPMRPPPKDVVEWLQRGWEGFTTTVTKKFEPQYPLIALIKPQEPVTTTWIKNVEQAQAWLREAPEEKQLIFTPLGKPEFKKPVTENLAQALETVYVPIGTFRTVEAIFKPVPTVTGAAVETLLSPIPKTQIGPLTIGKGGFTTEALSQYWEQTKKHPGLLVGEVIGEVALAKYVWGPAAEKAWSVMKKGAKIIYRKTPFYQRALYKRVTLAPQIAKELIPEEEVFRVLTKTKRGWEYIRLGTRETGKTTAWKPTVWKKPPGFKPRTIPWTPPQLLHVVREVPRTVSAGKGMALITKQVVKQVPKVTTKQVAKTVIQKTVPLTIPMLVQWTGTAYPKIMKGKQKYGLIALLKYPTEKPLQLPKYPTFKEYSNLVSKVSLTTVTKQTARPKTKTRLTPKTLEALIEAQIPDITQFEKLLQKQTPAIRQGIDQPQLLKQISGLKQPGTPFQRPRLRRQRKRRKKKKPPLFGAWFLKHHPIPTPEQLIKQLGG